MGIDNSEKMKNKWQINTVCTGWGKMAELVSGMGSNDAYFYAAVPSHFYLVVKGIFSEKS